MNTVFASALVQAMEEMRDLPPVRTAVGVGATILVIDDDEWFRLLVRGLLTKTPYRLIEARDGMEGIALLRNTPVDLMMTDIVMPGKGGLATIDEARSAFPGIKILAVSGVEDKEYFLRAAEMIGADATLKKPISRSGLLQILHSLM